MKAQILPVAAAAVVAMFWAGVLVGVSFLATPVKFQATSLSLPVALEVGRVTFWTFSRVEWGLAFLLVATAMFAKFARTLFAGTLATAVIVVVQALWLLPILDARVDAVIAGTSLSPSHHHMLYAVAEGVKLLLLCAVALMSLYRLGWAARPHGTRNYAPHTADRLRAPDADVPGEPPWSPLPGDRRCCGIRNLSQPPFESGPQAGAGGISDHRSRAQRGNSTRPAAGGHQLG